VDFDPLQADRGPVREPPLKLRSADCFLRGSEGVFPANDRAVGTKGRPRPPQAPHAFSQAIGEPADIHERGHRPAHGRGS